ncbi:MAG: aldehyde dehydrogenase [Cyanobacteria bacterium P01_E01_bin.45]
MTAQMIRPAIPDVVARQRQFFSTGQTKSLEFRLKQLGCLKQAIIDRQEDILVAAKADLGRPAFEAYFEIATLAEVNKALKDLTRWMRPEKVKLGIDQFPGSAWRQPEPLGVVLIIGPWNYPFQLMMSPLVGAIAAGNCAVLKPSEHAPHTSKVVADIVNAAFEPDYVAVFEGEVDTSQQLLKEKFDHIFFTGGTEVGRIIMQEAAKTLTPVTLELGGKSPCIVDADVKLDVAARRIAWGKFINAGQTCIAPDYILVDRRIQDAFIEQMRTTIAEFFGDNPEQSSDFGRIIHDRHFDRLVQFLSDAQVAIGGDNDRDRRYIAPTVLNNVSWDDAVMQEEIFGPILPVQVYDSLDEAISKINSRPKPLALYVFSSSSDVQERVLNSTSSGGACINDTVMHVGVDTLPFGGVGDSGIGAYHGKFTFDTFSHYKSVLKKGLWLDLKWRYAPYTEKGLKQIRKIVTGS